MADRFPLIIDINDNNRIKELPAGDNLDLSQSSIVNVASITTLGQVSVGSLLINGQTLSTAAVTGDYNDLVNTPTTFSGDYTDLSNKPFIPVNINNLADVALQQAQDGQVLIWSDSSNQWEPSAPPGLDLTTSSINDLNDVITTGVSENKYLKYYSGAWRAANITWTEINNRPLNLSQFNNDVGFVTEDTEAQTLSYQNGFITIENGNVIDISKLDITGSVFADDSSLVVDGTNGNVFATSLATNLISGEGMQIISGTQLVAVSDSVDIIGNNGINLATGESGTATIIADGAVFITSANDLINLDGDLNSTGNGFTLQHTGDGVISFGSSLQIVGTGQGDLIQIGNGLGEQVSLENAGSFQLPVYLDATERDAAILNPFGGMMVYLSSTGKFSGYDAVAGAWADLN